MKKVLHALQRLEKWIIVIAFVIMVVAIFCQVVNRNIFKIPVSGFEEAAKYSMAYMVLLGTELGLRDGTQIAIKGVVDKLKGKVKKVIVIISQIIVVAFAAIMTKASFAMVLKQAAIGQTSPRLGIPMSVPYFSLVLGFGLIAVVQAGELVSMIVHFNKPEDEMKEEVAALLMFGGFALLLILGVPIALSLGVSTMAAIAGSPDITVSINTVAQRIFGGLDSTSIMAIAFFVLSGNLMTKGGISRRICEFARSIIGGVRGGMALTLVLACAFFAALSGSAPATVVAIGTMLYGDMVRMGYPGDRTAGLLVVSGGLGPIIPPSIIMVVYATITGASVGDMFKSGMGIGIGIMIVLMIVVIVLAHKEQWPKDEIHFNLKEFCISFLKAIPALMLPIIILGGIYSGLLTATESSAIAVVWSFIAGMFIYRELKWSDLFDIFVDSAKSSAMTLFIIATSTAFAWLFAYAGISQKLVDFVIGMNLSATTYCLVVAVILLIFGTFLEGIATAVLLVPVLWPVAQALGVNVIHFGMIVSIANVVGTMTPPVAVNIFSAASVTKLSMGKIVHGQWPFFIGYVGFFFLVVFIPALSTFLL